jgi:hypothetical protein
MTETESGSGSTAEQGSSEQGATKKGTARKSTTRKAPAKKATAKSTPRRASARAASSPKRMTGMRAAAEAARQLHELTGKEAEGVVGLERGEDGWTVQVEVLELRRIPNTTDVLAVYEVSVDQDGDLEGYTRLRRYVRGTPEER